MESMEITKRKIFKNLILIMFFISFLNLLGLCAENNNSLCVATFGGFQEIPNFEVPQETSSLEAPQRPPNFESVTIYANSSERISINATFIIYLFIVILYMSDAPIFT